MSNSMRIMHFLIVPCIGFVLNKDAIIEDMYLICFVKECTMRRVFALNVKIFNSG